jgi:hypothetical protein
MTDTNDGNSDPSPDAATKLRWLPGEKMLAAVHVLNERLHEVSVAIGDANVAAHEEELAKINALSAVQDRFIEYFWNSKAARHRLEMSLDILCYLEADSRSREYLPLQPIQVANDVLRTIEALGRRGLIILDVEKPPASLDGVIRLTDLGAAHLAHKHPTLLARWQRLLEITPPFVSLIASIIGFVASIFGVIQFIDWLRT